MDNRRGLLESLFRAAVEAADPLAGMRRHLPSVPQSGRTVVVGAGIGLVSISRGSLPLYLFGPLEAPVISGRLGRPIAVTSALAPSIGAFLITRLGGPTTLGILTAVSVISVAAAIALRRLARKMAVLG